MERSDFPQKPPDFIDRRTIKEMGADEFDRHLDNIRTERMKGYKLYTQAEADKRAVADEKAREQLSKQYEMMGKEIERIDKTLEKMSDRFVKIQALRIQLGLDI